MSNELQIHHNEDIEHHRGLVTEFYGMSSNHLTSKDAFYISNNNLAEYYGDSPGWHTNKKQACQHIQEEKHF